MGGHSPALRTHRPLKTMLSHTRWVSGCPEVFFLAVSHWNAVRIEVLWHGHSWGFIMQHICWESQQAPWVKELLVELLPQTQELIYVSLLFSFFSSLYQGCEDHSNITKWWQLCTSLTQGRKGDCQSQNTESAMGRQSEELRCSLAMCSLNHSAHFQALLPLMERREFD